MLQLKTGKRCRRRPSDDGQLQWTERYAGRRHATSPVKTISIARDGDSSARTKRPPQLERRVEMRSREIRSLPVRGHRCTTAQVPDAWPARSSTCSPPSIDFRSDLRRGDRFNVVYETFWQDGEYGALRPHPGRRIHQPRRRPTNRLVRRPGSKQGGYYSFDGKA